MKKRKLKRPQNAAPSQIRPGETNLADLSPILLNFLSGRPTKTRRFLKVSQYFRQGEY